METLAGPSPPPPALRPLHPSTLLSCQGPGQHWHKRIQYLPRLVKPVIPRPRRLSGTVPRSRLPPSMHSDTGPSPRPPSVPGSPRHLPSPCRPHSSRRVERASGFIKMTSQNRVQSFTHLAQLLPPALPPAPGLPRAPSSVSPWNSRTVTPSSWTIHPSPPHPSQGRLPSLTFLRVCSVNT